MKEPSSLGAIALKLAYQGKDPPEIAQILTAEQCSASQEITPRQARELYQTEFARQRADR